ncbi:hypothetical protein CI109_100838 [Kwoniella shandongensis]|uniref:Uncharacterized protein n=1 Tax=Kwoniella shandongensis TaxID=1734106 RepID=A0A5M6BRX4_9TREE|nr:uncharacterized protein CI109_006090 [Kwoniella shandongensis]KAA5525517.1 hypothetical protein CI109_006090 [Kwoniella shandongensis]
MASPTEGDPTGSSLPAPGPRRYLPSQPQILRALTLTQNTSALVFSVFLVPHLASPIVAVVGGLEGADKTMMIARDLYLPLEPVLIYLPLALHLLSSVTRRLVLLSSSTSTSSFRSRLPRQIHQILGYPLAILVSTHILTHRLIPSLSTPPISNLSPSELGWEFVGYNLRYTSAWATYLFLIGAGVWHSTVGGMKIVSWLRGPKSSPSKAVAEVDQKEKKEVKRTVSWRRKLGLRGLVVAFLGVISIGLARVSADTGPISSVMLKRYDAVFAQASWANYFR